LFRLFDWGNADVTWNPGLETDVTSLHIDANEATVLYGEHLQDRSSLEGKEQEKLNQALSTGSLVAGYESVLKHYTIRLECVESSLLPGGFNFVDATKNSYVIGSSDDCDVVIRHASVDPLHCGLILENGAVYVWDLGSQGGLKLNGAPIAEGKLKVGDVMTLGSVDVRVRFQLKRPSIQRPKTLPLPAMNNGPTTQKVAPPKELPKGAITYEKVSKQLNNRSGATPFLNKLTALFGGKDKK
jgi:hypothetical protein